MAHSSSSDNPQLSPDIIESIIDFVAQNSARNWNGSLGKDILNCALVNQTFRHRAQFHIFEAVYIRHEPKYRIERLQNLKDLIKTNPDISLSVQQLFLECRGLEYAWIGEDPTFLNIMESITGNGRPLRKLTLEADEYIDDGYGTMRIPDFQPLLERFFRPFILPFITTLVLDRLENVPIEVIAGCPQLVDLELLHVELVETSEGAVTFHSRPALKRLATRLTTPIDILEKALDLSRLDTYEICRDGLPDLRSEQRIIDAAGASLHVLKIYSLNTECKPVSHSSSTIHVSDHVILVNEEIQSFNGSCSLDNSVRLHTLDMETNIPEDNLLSVLSTIETIPAQNSLRTFSVSCNFGIQEACGPEAILAADWHRFCSEILRITQGESFSLSIKLHYVYSGDSSDEQDNEDLEIEDIDINDRCASTVSRLRSEKLSKPTNLPTCTFDISHTAYRRTSDD